MYGGNADYLLGEILYKNQSFQAPRLPTLANLKLFLSLRLLSAVGGSHFCNEVTFWCYI